MSKGYNQKPVENKDLKTGEKKGIIEKATDIWENLSDEDKAKLKKNVIGGIKDLLKAKKEGKLTAQKIYNVVVSIAIGGAIVWNAAVPRTVVIEGLNEAEVDSIATVKADSIIKENVPLTIIDDNVYLMNPDEAQKLYEEGK